MKKLFVFVLLLIASPAMAHTVTTSGTATPSHTALHTHTVTIDDKDTTRQEFGYGVGADVVLYQPYKYGVDEIVAEGRYDIENRETRVFVVARINPWEFNKSN